MHKNCFPFPLKTESLIVEYVREYLKDSNTKPVYAVALPLPDNILEVVNTELVDQGLPKISSSMAFKRKDCFKANQDACHIDYSAGRNSTLKSSLVIPIDGCEDTYMYWYDGDYSADIVIPAPDFLYAYPYMKLTWNAPGSLVEQVEISKGPMLCRVDVPHSATSRKDRSYRLVMTLRFEENLSIEEIMTRCSSMDRTNSS